MPLGSGWAAWFHSCSATFCSGSAVWFCCQDQADVELATGVLRVYLGRVCILLS